MPAPLCPLRRQLLGWSGAALCLPLAAQTPRRLILAGTEDTRRTLIGDWLAAIYGSALAKLGWELDYRVFPPKRAYAMVSEGKADGEIHRAANYGRLRSGLVRVDEPHFLMRFAAYGRAGTAPLAGWASLRARTERVEYCLGVEAAAAALAAQLPPQRLSQVASIRLGLRKLELQRSDIFIDLDTIVDAELHSPEFARAGIVKLGILEELPFHAFLRADKADLAPPLAQVLREMKRSGQLEALRPRPPQRPPP